MFLIYLCAEQVCNMKKDPHCISLGVQNFFSKEHSNCDIFHLTVSWHAAKQYVQNCVTVCKFAFNNPLSVMTLGTKTETLLIYAAQRLDADTPGR